MENEIIYKIIFTDYIYGNKSTFYTIYNCENIFSLIKKHINKERSLKDAKDYSKFIFDILENNSIELENIIDENDNYITYNINYIRITKKYITYNIIIDFNYINVYNNVESYHYNIKPKTGICVDKYISHVIEPKLNNIYVILSNISNKDRIKNNYIESLQYENDFSAIRNIKINANKIVKYCDKIIEHIHEMKNNN